MEEAEGQDDDDLEHAANARRVDDLFASGLLPSEPKKVIDTPVSSTFSAASQESDRPLSTGSCSSVLAAKLVPPGSSAATSTAASATSTVSADSSTEVPAPLIAAVSSSVGVDTSADPAVKGRPPLPPNRGYTNVTAVANKDAPKMRPRSRGSSPRLSATMIQPEATTGNATASSITAAATEGAGYSGTRRKGGVTFSAYLTDYDVVMSVAEARGWRVHKSEEKADKCNVLWIDKPEIEEWLRRVEPWMRVNHFPGMNQALARKTRLARNMARMQRLFPKDYKFLPPTWVLPDQLGELERRFDGNGESKSIFIAKPDHLCQGRGIFLTNNLEKIKRCVTDRDEPVVVQQYIGKPMLIDGLKFDLRLYFLVCGVTQESGGISCGITPRCFLFRDGLVRLCTRAYQAPTADTLDDKCMHLTNYAINKKSSNFEQNNGDDDGAGSKRSLRWFMNYVEQEFGERERTKLWQKLAGLCVKMILTVHPTLEAEYGGVFPKDLSGGRAGCRCFEVLGVDVMLDRKRKPYLIEVNHLPSFTCDSPLDEDIKRRLVEQTLDLTCGTISAGDRQAYEAFVKERAESRPRPERIRRESSVDGATRAGPRSTGVAKTSPPPSGAWTAEPSPEGYGSQPEGGEPALIANELGDSSAASTSFEMENYRDFERVFPATSSNATAKQAALYNQILERVAEVFRPVNAPRRVPKEKESVDVPPVGSVPPPPKIRRPPGPGPDTSGHRSRAEGQSPSRASNRSRSAPGPGPPRCALVGLRVVERRLDAAQRARSSSAQRASDRISLASTDKPCRVVLPLKTVAVTL